jgi:hypothetical protein
MNLDSVTYGNPTQEQLGFLSKETYLDYLFDDLVPYRFPKNSSDATKEELNQIVDYIEILNKNENHLKWYRIYDRGFKSFFVEGLKKEGIDEQEALELINSIMEDVKPLIIKLKYYFQRPRPYQIAEYYKLKLFPFESKSADTPSFPSGHAFQGKIITEVLGNRYPNLYGNLVKVLDDICYSRVYMGLHYQSDIDVGIFCAEKVLSDLTFMGKYKL